MSHNQSIHGLRGFAALIVVLLHIQVAVETAGFPLRLNPRGPAARMFAHGHHGVELFFMISGYVIVRSLQRRTVPQFLAQRVRRIYPAFLAAHLAIFLAGPLVGYAFFTGLNWQEYVWLFTTNALMLPGYFAIPAANIVAWTLSLELAFYLLAASAVTLSRACLRRPVRLALWAIWLAAAIVSLYQHPRAWFFVAGVLAFAIEQKGNSPSAANSAQETRTAWIALPAFAAMSCLARWSPSAAFLWGLVGFLGVMRQRDVFCRVLRGRVLQHLGDISYSLYLWHVLALYPLKRIFGGQHGLFGIAALDLIAFLASAAVLSWGTAWLSYRLVERRFLPKTAEIRQSTIPQPHFSHKDRLGNNCRRRDNPVRHFLGDGQDCPSYHCDNR